MIVIFNAYFEIFGLGYVKMQQIFFYQFTVMLEYIRVHFDAVSILNVYKAALTYMISMNILMTLFNTVQLLLIIFV